MTVGVIESRFAGLDIDLDEGQVKRLERYVALLQKWNRVYNLTAIRDVERMVTHHLVDSLAVVPYITGPRVLDVGSGAGLPGIPLAIARRDFRVTLLDSNQKKAAFLRQAIAELGLPNAEVRAERVETWSAPQGFETILARAFAPLSELIVKSRHLLASGGVLAAMKGAYPAVELASLPAGFRVRDVIKLHVPGVDAERHLILVEAIG